MFPKLKNARLCRIATYVTVIGGFMLPAVFLFAFDIGSDGLKSFVLILQAIGMVHYIFKNLDLLMGLDLVLAILHCHHIARSRYPLSRRFQANVVEKRIARYGHAFTPQSTSPCPDCLRYTFRAPITIYSSGVVKVVAVYHTEYLDEDLYQEIMRSAMIHSKAVVRKEKRFHLDKYQQKAPLNHSTVAIVFAKRTNQTWLDTLYDQMRAQSGAGEDTVLLPCVIDEEQKVCVFDSEPEPYMGFGYPAKTRGYHLIRKLVFGGRMRLSKNPYKLEPMEDMDDEKSLWMLWWEWKQTFRDVAWTEKLLSRMQDGEVVCNDEKVYVKVGERGIVVGFKRHEAFVEIEEFNKWTYPKSQRLSDNSRKRIQSLIIQSFEKEGCEVRFISSQE